MTELWCPWAIRDDRRGSSSQDLDDAIVVLHTTETNGPASYSGTEPHFEVSLQAGVIQFHPLDVYAKALYNAPGGIETNRRAGGVIQIEIVWHAGDAADMPDELLRRLAELLVWIGAQIGKPLVPCPQGFHGAGEGMVLASEDSPIRFHDAAEWRSPGLTTGVAWSVCAHQHVDENDHWDTGALPWARLAQFFGPPPEEDTMAGWTDADHYALNFLAQLENDLKAGYYAHLGDGDYFLGMVRRAEVDRRALGLPPLKDAQLKAKAATLKEAADQRQARALVEGPPPGLLPERHEEARCP